jgi:hypothetical protein
MLDHDLRATILRLQTQGHGIRTIARTLRVSRKAVRRVLRSGSPEVPPLEREDTLTPHLERIRELHQRCQGNRVRVAELLAGEGLTVPYSTLTHFCRRHGIGTRPKPRAGHYHFAPGEEMQHDTSPHTVTVGEHRRPLQCASLVLCYSRLIFAQAYPRWSRFQCKVFLTEALQHCGGVARRCMIDNSSVILAGGTGRHARIAPEMEAFATRFGFRFAAHELGDANRSARVERPFHFIEHNFYPGRSFSSFADLNQQLRAWCEQVNRRPKRALAGATPLELFAAEAPALLALPLHVPEVYEPHLRRVDVDGYVNLHTNRYSVPATLIGRRLEVRETANQIRIFDGPRLVIAHERQEPGAHQRLLRPEHQEPRRSRRPTPPPTPEEILLRRAAPRLAPLIDALRRHYGGQAARAVRQLHRLYLDYPLDVLVAAVETALAHRLIDPARIERMVLRRLAGEFFRLPLEEDGRASEEDPHD